MSINIPILVSIRSIFILLILTLNFACTQHAPETTTPAAPVTQTKKEVTAKDILGNPDYLAISYGGYRQNTRDIQPTVVELKEDMQILHAMGVRIVRTYNVQLPQAFNLVEAIHQFGIFTIQGQAKYALWDLVDKGAFKGLGRGENAIGKTYKGDKEALLKEVELPPFKKELKIE